MKLEIKHLATYLPYGLTVKWGADTANLTGLIRDCAVLSGEYWNGSQKTSIENIKPLLRNLSDLTKEIEHNGERFVPMHVLFELEYPSLKKPDWHKYYTTDVPNYTSCSHNGCAVNSTFLKMSIDKNPKWITDKLHEWKFDLYSLIENNLAVDINTTEK